MLHRFSSKWQVSVWEFHISRQHLSGCDIADGNPFAVGLNFKQLPRVKLWCLIIIIIIEYGFIVKLRMDAEFEFIILNELQSKWKVSISLHCTLLGFALWWQKWVYRVRAGEWRIIESNILVQLQLLTTLTSKPGPSHQHGQLVDPGCRFVGFCTLLKLYLVYLSLSTLHRTFTRNLHYVYYT